MVGVGLVAMVVGSAGLGARATYGARVTADEPQYLLTAISLGEDRDLDISDEIADGRYRSFHEVPLNPQTVPLDATGRRVSPHDPLLPLLLAGPVLLGGWVGAKLFLLGVVGLTAALTLRFAVDRLGAPLVPASVVVAGFFATPPLATYGTQIYPATPAALAVIGGVVAVTGRPTRRGAMVAGLAVIALPWLAVKYVPVAAVLATAGIVAHRRRVGRWPWTTVAVYVVAAIAYLALHRLLYGGWTAYATGDHFVDGELLVVGADPDYVGRTRRLIGLVVDRMFGIGAWHPAYLGLYPALVWLVVRRRPGWPVVLAAVGAGWAVATWVALTMHGWWWPGRQIVPVLPLVVAAMAAAVGTSRRLLAATSVASALGVVTWLILAWEASTGRLTLIVDFDDTASPWYRVWRLTLPDHQRMGPWDVVLTAGWVLLVVGLCVVVARRSGDARPTAIRGPTGGRSSAPIPAGVEPGDDRPGSPRGRQPRRGPFATGPSSP